MAGHLHKSYALNHFWCADDSYHNRNAMYTVVLTMPVTTYTQYTVGTIRRKQMGREKLYISARMPSISETLTLALWNLGGGMHRYGAACSGFPPPLSTTVAGCHHGHSCFNFQ